MTEVLMPRLSDSMEEGTIVRWLLAEGVEAAVGTEIVEIETDKANMVYEAESAGALHILVAEGETVAVGAPIAHLGDVPDVPDTAAPPAASGGRPPQAVGSAHPPRANASPVARRLAADRGVDLIDIVGSGPRGRIVKADVEAAIGQGPAPALVPTPASTGSASPASPATASPDTGKGAPEVIELSRVQQLIARRMAESKATAPDFALSREVEMDAAVELRENLKKWTPEGDAPSYNDLIVKACGLALRDHPRANGAYRDGRWELYPRVNVGIAVAGSDGGLIVPTIPDADRLGVAEISRLSRRLAAAARDGSITAPDLSGGTFTVSNLGMFGVDSFTAVINPPQAAILAVGALQQRIVPREGEPALGWRMTATLCCDHRILSGADGAALLARIAELLASPGALVL